MTVSGTGTCVIVPRYWKTGDRERSWGLRSRRAPALALTPSRAVTAV